MYAERPATPKKDDFLCRLHMKDKQDLVHIIRSIAYLMYGTDGDYDFDQEVDGGDFVEGVAEQFQANGLLPDPSTNE